MPQILRHKIGTMHHEGDDIMVMMHHEGDDIVVMMHHEVMT